MSSTVKDIMRHIAFKAGLLVFVFANEPDEKSARESLEAFEVGAKLYSMMICDKEVKRKIDNVIELMCSMYVYEYGDCEE